VFCISFCFQLTYVKPERNVVHKALAVADGVEDAQDGGLGIVLLAEVEVQGPAEVVRVHELPDGIPGRADVGHIP